jgi:hypothetical protein
VGKNHGKDRINIDKIKAEFKIFFKAQLDQIGPRSTRNLNRNRCFDLYKKQTCISMAYMTANCNSCVMDTQKQLTN